MQRKSIFIGATCLNSKIAARQFIRRHRESGFLNPQDSAALQVFFKVAEPVSVHYNREMKQFELYSGQKRLNSNRAIDYAFLKAGDAEQERRLRRAHAIEKARNLVHWDGSARSNWLKNNDCCIKCDSKENLEVDHIKQFISIWTEFGEPYIGEFDEADWIKFHDERATFQTLCKSCHRCITLHRKKWFKVLDELSQSRSRLYPSNQ